MRPVLAPSSANDSAGREGPEASASKCMRLGSKLALLEQRCIKLGGPPACKASLIKHKGLFSSGCKMTEGLYVPQRLPAVLAAGH